MLLFNLLLLSIFQFLKILHGENTMYKNHKIKYYTLSISSTYIKYFILYLSIYILFSILY